MFRPASYPTQSQGHHDHAATHPSDDRRGRRGPAVPLRHRASKNGAGTNKLLRYIPTADLSVLDPSWTTTQVSITHGYYVFDTLFAIDSTQKPQPQMAEGYTVSEDGRTWDIKLRDGLTFHDGEKVLARDAAASLKRWSARDVYGQTLAGFVDEWGTADDRTVRIKLKSPFPCSPTRWRNPTACCRW